MYYHCDYVTEVHFHYKCVITNSKITCYNVNKIEENLHGSTQKLNQLFFGSLLSLSQNINEINWEQIDITIWGMTSLSLPEVMCYSMFVYLFVCSCNICKYSQWISLILCDMVRYWTRNKWLNFGAYPRIPLIECYFIYYTKSLKMHAKIETYAVISPALYLSINWYEQ